MTEITILLDKYLSDQLSLEELDRFRELVKNEEYNLILSNAIEEVLRQNRYKDEIQLNEQDVLSKILVITEEIRSGDSSPKPMRIPIRVLWAAASLLLILSTCTYIWFQYNQKKRLLDEVKQTSKSSNDIPPGKTGAILTLSDGTEVVLDSLGNGEIAMQNGAKVVMRNHQLIYAKEQLTDGKIPFNTMVTHKGRQFSLILPDGTKVWMNAASSLKYPTVFKGRERLVEITGEVYFEVAKNTQMPFRVKVNDLAEVEVLGTHFNVKAYPEEKAINTTLLEGSIKASIYSSKETKANSPAKALSDNRILNQILLKPGQQAQMKPSEKIRVNENVDIEQVMAWKNGLFDFNDATLQEAMTQLSRWYDIEVEYPQGVPTIEFAGKMSRNVNLSDLLEGLEIFGVHFRLEGDRRLIILK